MCEVHVSACTCGGQGGLLSDQTMEVTGSSRVAFFSFIFLSLSLYLSLSFSSRLPSQPPPSRGPHVALASDLGRGAGGVTVGLGGAEVGGRGPQRRRALHKLVPLGRVHLRRPKTTGG